MELLYDYLGGGNDLLRVTLISNKSLLDKTIPEGF